MAIAHDPPQRSALDRRTFVKTLSAVGLGAALGESPGALAAQMPGAERRRYAIVGTGSRHGMYRTAIEGAYSEHAELVALCDTNPGRMELSRQRSFANGAPMPPAYLAGDFDRMVQETAPQVIIVTTMDSTHSDYIVRGMELGCDVITEKPMTTTAEKCQAILDAKARTGRNVRVTFNYRYSPPRTQVKDILMSGDIGEVLSVDFQWLLNTSHGADYFRRWHSRKEFSGGLMVHKATHHFDLVNWWLGAMPAEVFATGKREFYTPEMARRMGLSSHHERCLTCPEKDRCSFYMDLSQGDNRQLYLEQEHHDGYFRDRCVFRPEIDIEDNMNVLVGYDNGVNLTYSLNAFNAWEGYTMAFNGTKGRLEHRVVEQIYVSGTDTVQGAIMPRGVTTRIIPMRGQAREIEPWTGVGSHGGGDSAMLDDVFLTDPPADRYERNADERAGACSILIGVAANRCFETGQPVRIADLVTGLGRPDFAPMPSRSAPLPMPRAPQ